MRILRTHTSHSGYKWSFGSQKHTRGFVKTSDAASQTHKGALVIPKWSSQCVHHTCWRLAWGKLLLIASNHCSLFGTICPVYCVLLLWLFRSPSGDSWCMVSYKVPSQALGILPHHSLTAFSLFLLLCFSVVLLFFPILLLFIRESLFFLDHSDATSFRSAISWQ